MAACRGRARDHEAARWGCNAATQGRCCRDTEGLHRLLIRQGKEARARAPGWDTSPRPWGQTVVGIDWLARRASSMATLQLAQGEPREKTHGGHAHEAFVANYAEEERRERGKHSRYLGDRTS